jgi:hypothetical protein
MSAVHRTDLPPLPDRFEKLPLDARGYPVPWFVAWIDGKPDFRVVRPDGIGLAHRGQRCWLCGEPRGKFGAFVIGPMCAVNRVSSEPPSHLSCAKFAAMACPFLTKPLAKRNERDLPTETKDAAGCMIARNPGVTLVWVTASYEPFRAPGGVLFEIGPPDRLYWFAHGREATRAEIMASIDSGYPLLQEMAAQDGPAAIAELDRQYQRAMELVPA